MSHETICDAVFDANLNKSYIKTKDFYLAFQNATGTCVHKLIVVS